MKQTLIAVIRTLNAVTVSGADNMNRLLGCIQALESLLKELEDKDDGRQTN